MHAITVAIPRPCAESWAAMTAAPGGRHCAACQKVVVDFTHKTDAELVAYFRQAGGSRTCGRLRPDQLGRALQPAAPVSRGRAWLASVLALGGVLGAGRAVAQSRSNYAGPLPEAVSPAVVAAAGPTPPARPAAPVGPQATPAAELLLVQGLVLDDATGQPLPGVVVMVKGTATGTSTTSEGRFSLTPASATDSLRLSIGFIGYTRQEVTVSRGSQPLTVRLRADEVMLGGEVVIVGAVASRQPWPWHPRALYGWTRYRIRQLLRH